jgi:hypothetical protein
VWTELLTAIPNSHTRAILRTALAQWTRTTEIPDQTRKNLQLAAREADAEPEDASHALVSLSRQTVRNAGSGLGLDDLPAWATTALPDTHLNLLTAVGSATDWPTLRTALDTHRDTLDCPGLTASLDAYQALQPTDSTPLLLRQILEGIHSRNYDSFVEEQQTLYAHMKLIRDWTAASSSAESAEFLRSHQEVLTTPEFRRTLSTIDKQVVGQQLGMIELATTLTADQACAIVTDSTVAEKATLDAIEAGDTARLNAIAAAAPDLRTHATTWSLLSAVLCLTEHNLNKAMSLGQQVAEQGSPMIRRAHAVRLRSFGTHNPDTAGIQDLAKTVDSTPGMQR